MTRMYPTLFSSVAITLALGLNSPALAQSSSVTVETARGEAVVDRSITRDGGATTGSSTLSTPNGNADRTFDRAFDAETGTYSATRATTTANGAEVTSSATVICDGNGVCTRDGAYVGPRGGAGGSETTAIRSSQGDVTARTITTRPDGTSLSRDRTVTGNPGDRSGEVVQTGPRGETVRQFERGFERGDGLSTSSATTGPEGRTRAVERRRQVTNGRGIEANASITSPRGETRERRRWVRVDRED